MIQVLCRFDHCGLLLTLPSEWAVPAKEIRLILSCRKLKNPNSFPVPFPGQPSGDTAGPVASKGSNVTDLPSTAFCSKSHPPASPQSREIMVFQGISASASSQRSLTDRLVLNTPNYEPN